MQRYLLRISYIGTSFRGSQRQVAGGSPRADDPSTVQGSLEMALKKLNPSNEPVVSMASRTDKGVHALNAVCHVDLSRDSKMIYEPRSVVLCLNKHFKKWDVPIRVIRGYLVPSDFHCRQRAISRTYLYRLVHTKSHGLGYAPNFNHFPIEELNRSLFYCSDNFDVDLMHDGAELFKGVHDFRTFMGMHKGRGNKYHNENQVTRKEIHYIKIVENDRLFGYCPYSWPKEMDSNIGDYKCLDIYIKGKGFLYKQVRRTVASLIALGQGKLSVRDLKLMLQVPSAKSWPSQIKTVPAYGLYLCQVDYSQSDIDSCFRTQLDQD